MTNPKSWQWKVRRRTEISHVKTVWMAEAVDAMNSLSAQRSTVPLWVSQGGQIELVHQVKQGDVLVASILFNASKFAQFLALSFRAGRLPVTADSASHIEIVENI